MHSKYSQSNISFPNLDHLFFFFFFYIRFSIFLITRKHLVNLNTASAENTFIMTSSFNYFFIIRGV
jgi:hypothetical protein